MRLYITLLLLVIVLFTGCRNEFADQADAAMVQKKYFKAFSLYKQAIKKSPGRQVLYNQLEKAASQISIKGMQLLHQLKYQECIDYLKPMIEENEYPHADSRIISAIAYIYGHSYNGNNIKIGLQLIQEVLARARQPFQVVSFLQDDIKWLSKHGISNEEILSSRFNNADIAAIYRSFLYHALAQKLSNGKVAFKWMQERGSIGFPIPEGLKPEEKKRLEKTYLIFDWFIHNIQPIQPDNPLYYDAVIPDIITGGYGTIEQIIQAFIYVMFQADIPVYMLEYKEQYWALVNTGEKWVVLDFIQGIPWLDAESGKLQDFQNLIKEEKIKKGVVWVVFPPRTIVPRLSLLPHMFQQIYGMPAPPYFHFRIYNLARRAQTVIAGKVTPDIAFREPVPEKLSVAFYSRQLKIWSLYQTKEYKDKIQTARDLVKFFIQAREKDWQGAYEKALELYKGLPKDSTFSQHIPYFQALTYAHKGDYATARQLLQEYLQKSPQGFYKSYAHLYLGRLYSLAGEYQQAQEHYLQSGRIPTETQKFYIKTK